MKLLVVGTREDVAGFALAGVDGVACATREQADAAIARADEETLVIVSAELATGGWQPAGNRLSVVIASPGSP